MSDVTNRCGNGPNGSSPVGSPNGMCSPNGPQRGQDAGSCRPTAMGDPLRSASNALNAFPVGYSDSGSRRRARDSVPMFGSTSTLNRVDASGDGDGVDGTVVHRLIHHQGGAVRTDNVGSHLSR